MQIEIDFEVYKELTMRRETETVTYNDVVRRLLNLPPVHQPSMGEAVGLAVQNMAKAVRGSGVPWIYKGIRFPEGTDFRATYQGVEHRAQVRQGVLEVNGKPSPSPSDAARQITGNNVNGWTFWECRFPGESQWRFLKSLRASAP